ncbi:acyl carrier protein [Streptomyces sp. ME02-6991-2A]|uniref:acyl carrier protein n=1 Tax=Streptomyces TaxID=1883 RepID=UPI00100840F4|nr:acyl carrier protein [Streptomyces sp. ME02-6991-2A]MDX3376668.1 acyl carrier protein [Streptomyces sp. ME02-6991-2A]
MKTSEQESNHLAFVAQTIEEVSGVPASDASPEKLLVDELGIDSLSLVEITFTLQKVAGVEIPEEEMAGVRSVADLVDLLPAGRSF